MTVSISAYRPDRADEWDSFITDSKNGTFLHCRKYMDYHSDRFTDASLLIQRDNALVAVLPANVEGAVIHSHQGLTYGGLIVGERMTTPLMLAVFEHLQEYLHDVGFKSLIYKTIPSIYTRLPSEEDRYALFRAGAVLYRRDVLSVLQPRQRPQMQNRRRRGAKEAAAAGVVCGESTEWAAYWQLLTAHLTERFGVMPVHSLQEIERLQELFPKNIRLFTAEVSGTVVAGAVIYESTTTAHVQYIGSSSRGRDVCALDAVFPFLLEEVFVEKPFFDFGISNEDEGKVLNVGLVEQKEGFGGRAIAHDFYEVSL